jgi:hypothetical protein
MESAGRVVRTGEWVAGWRRDCAVRVPGMAGTWRGISAGGTGDLLDPVPDNVTHDLVRQRRGGSEPDGSLGQLEGRQPAAHCVDDLRTERKDAEMMLGSQKSQQGLPLVLTVSVAIP